ncbi:MAG TPA: hypothetical protein VMA83_04825 [Solirubrobacteraceae bacterium]|nr:hypothetical protein [Solirubrobacteraceae bacterium]
MDRDDASLGAGFAHPASENRDLFTEVLGVDPGVDDGRPFVHDDVEWDAAALMFEVVLGGLAIDHYFWSADSDAAAKYVERAADGVAFASARAGARSRVAARAESNDRRDGERERRCPPRSGSLP